MLGGLEDNRWPQAGEELAVDGIVYLSTRTSGISLERIFLSCAQMLGGDEEQDLLRTWSQLNVEPAEKIDRLHRALTGGVYVILLDHFQDLLDERARIVDEGLRQFVERSLVARVDARLLLTTRVPLDLPPECRAHDHHVPIDTGLSTDEGVAMLRDLDPSGSLLLRDAPEEALAQAVTRLHGVPRALEAVATLLTRNPFDKLDEVLARFYGEEDVVNALVTDAYRTLEPDARTVVDALAVLGRPAPLWAVEFVVAGFAPGVDVPGILTRLVWSRMVIADRQAKTATLHPVDRDIVFERLPREGEYSRPTLERRAADYYAQLRTAPETWRTLVDIEPHLSEFRHRLAAGDVDGAARVLSEVDIPFLIWRGFTRQAVAMRAELEGRIGDKRLRLLHAAAMGQAFILLGPPEKAIEWMERTVALARDLGDVENERQAKGWIGEANRRLGRIDDALEILREVVAGYDPAVTAPQFSALLEYSLTCSYAGELDEAVSAANRLLTLGVELGDANAEARGHDCLSLACLRFGRPSEALEHAERAVELYATIDAVDPLAYVRNVEGMAHIALGRLDEGLAALREAQRDGKEDDNPRIEGFALFNLACATRMAGDAARAAVLAENATAVLTAVGAAEARAAEALHAGLEAEARAAPAEAAAAYRRCAQLVERAPDLFPAGYFTAAADELSAG
ncbi:MAG TPA: tetratricopeptide repeat protein [Acidimicrobiales bacterium]